MFGPQSQEERFSNLASTVVSSLNSPSQGQLESSILKISEDQDLNAEQIKRLTEATNQAMYARMLTLDENKFDKTGSFPIADSKSVINQYYSRDAEKDMSKVASEIGSDLRDYYESPSAWLEKTAGEETRLPVIDPKLSETIDMDPKRGYLEKLSFARKVRDSLNSERNTLKLNVAESIDKLSCMFSYDQGPDHKRFEKQAFIIYGNESLPFLNLVREQLNLPSLNGFDGIEKLGKVVFDDKSEELILIKQALESAKKYSKVSRKFKEFKQVLGDY